MCCVTPVSIHMRSLGKNVMWRRSTRPVQEASGAAAMSYPATRSRAAPPAVPCAYERQHPDMWPDVLLNPSYLCTILFSRSASVE